MQLCAERCRLCTGAGAAALVLTGHREGRERRWRLTAKKHRAPVPVFQRDPGPWSRLLIDWLGHAGRYYDLWAGDAVQRQLHHRLPAHGRQLPLHQAAGAVHDTGAWLYVPDKLCGSPFSAQDGGAGVLHRAGHAGRHPDHGTPERLPPLDPLCRPYAAILGGGKV